jgi:hypothetical protein
MTTQLELCNQPIIMAYRGMLYLLAPWSRELLEKLTLSHLVKKSPAFYGIRRFITAFTSARHLSLSWASSIHSITPPPTSWISILFLSSHLGLGLPSGLIPSVFPTKPCIRLSSPPYALHATPISFFSECYRSKIWRLSHIIRCQYYLHAAHIFDFTVGGTFRRCYCWRTN